MNSSWARLRFPLSIALVVAGTAFMASPTLKTKAFFALSRKWQSNGTPSESNQFPKNIAWLFGRFVPVWVEIEPNITMLIDPYDKVTGSIFMDGDWEKPVRGWLFQHLPPDGTFVDIGAHVGWYSLKAAKVLGPNGRVIAIEPNPETLVKLRANITASKRDGMILVAPVACSDSESRLKFYASSRVNTGESSLSAKNASLEGPVTSYEVQARRLDDILSDAGVRRVDAIKLDVEGAELFVLKGGAATLNRFKPVIVVELIDRQLNAMGTSVKEVNEFMQANGYQVLATFDDNTAFGPVSKR